MVDNPFICCSFSSEAKCITPKDHFRFFDCSRILKTELLITTGAIGIIALLSNVTFLYYLSKSVFNDGDCHNLRVHALFMSNLALTCLLMVLYLFSLILGDQIWREQFTYLALNWVQSIHCSLTGFIFFTSIQGFFFFIVLISVNQFILLLYPEYAKKINMKAAMLISIATWLVAAVYGVINSFALRLETDFHDLSRFCIGLPVFYPSVGLSVRNNQQYAFQVPIALIILLQNSACLFMVMYCYIYIRKELNRMTERELNEEDVAFRKKDKNGSSQEVDKVIDERVEGLALAVEVISSGEMMKDQIIKESDETESLKDEQKNNAGETTDKDVSNNKDDTTVGDINNENDNESEDEKLFAMSRNASIMIFINFLILSPILILAMISYFAVIIPAEVYWWLLIVLLPGISVINPVIYGWLRCDCKGKPPPGMTQEEIAQASYEQALSWL